MMREDVPDRAWLDAAGALVAAEHVVEFQATGEQGEHELPYVLVFQFDDRP